MLIFLFGGVGLILVGGSRLVAWGRKRCENANPPWLSRVRAIAEAAAWACGGVLLILTAFGARGNAWPMTMLSLCLLSVSVSWVAARVTRAANAMGVVSVRMVLLRWGAASIARIRLGVRGANQIVLPTGWNELRFSFSSIERVFTPRSMVLGYLIGLGVLPVIFAASFIWTMRSGSGTLQSIWAVFVGYNALMVISCLTAAAIATLLFLAILKYARVLLVQLDIQGAFRSVATWTGYGTAAGVVTAALLPVMSRVLPLQSAFDPGLHLATVLSPQLLIDIPAAFALLGYGLGLIVATVSVCKQADNLLIRRIVAPALLIGALAALAHAGMGPRGLLEFVANGVPQSSADLHIDCNDEAALEQHLGEPGWILQALIACDAPILIESGVFTGTVAGIVAMLAVSAFVVDFRRRNAKKTAEIGAERAVVEQMR